MEAEQEQHLGGNSIYFLHASLQPENFLFYKKLDMNLYCMSNVVKKNIQHYKLKGVTLSYR